MPTAHYEIRVEGHLDRGRWSGWFAGMDVRLTEGGNTVISGPVIDQSALHGLLAQVRDLGLNLISVHRTDPRALPDVDSEKE